jgi:hypothetical protein
MPEYSGQRPEALNGQVVDALLSLDLLCREQWWILLVECARRRRANDHRLDVTATNRSYRDHKTSVAKSGSRTRRGQSGEAHSGAEQLSARAAGNAGCKSSCEAPFRRKSETRSLENKIHADYGQENPSMAQDGGRVVAGTALISSQRSFGVSDVSAARLAFIASSYLDSSRR